MRTVESIATTLILALIVAVIVGNATGTSSIINSIAGGTQSVFATILTGSRDGRR